MPQTDLHCTAHFSPLKRYFHFEQNWLKGTTPQESLLCNDMYSGPQLCALSVTITKEQALFDLFSDRVPHVSIAKTDDVIWEDSGAWLKSVLQLLYGSWEEQNSTEREVATMQLKHTTPA
ncbi:unnamed protein product [Coregonus sp. 'balchen']|nr:unnamed protein product [Coregonus sp. 'balchen']